jgi:hypothetical protein
VEAVVVLAVFVVLVGEAHQVASLPYQYPPFFFFFVTDLPEAFAYL